MIEPDRTSDRLRLSRERWAFCTLFGDTAIHLDISYFGDMLGLHNSRITGHSYEVCRHECCGELRTSGALFAQNADG